MARVVPFSLVILLLAASSATAVAPSPVPAVLPTVDPILRADPDGGRTIVAVLEDGVGGTYRHVPVSDAGLAAFTSALQALGVAIDPIVYGGELKEMGAFAHSFTLGGTPYMTLGVYTRTASNGLLRLPVVMIENVADIQGAALLLASVVGDDAMPLAAEAIPHTYGLVAPDAGAIMPVAAVAIVLVAAAPILAVATVHGQDAGQSAFNVPPEAYTALYKLGGDAFLLAFPLLFGTTGLPGPAGAPAPYSEDFVDRPEVRFWTARKTAAGHEAWAGTYLAREGSSNNGPAGAFSGLKRVETGVATRVDGATLHAAGLYVEMRATRASGASAQDTHARYTVGATAADTADVPLASLDMTETRADHRGSIGLFPASQRNDWRLGVHAAGAFVPLVGARTESRHDIHQGTTNLGQSVTEIETERTTSVGAYANGQYVPLVGARYWGERHPVESFAVSFLLIGGGPGDQFSGDVEVSLGTFVLGQYTPLVGARLDDDFAGHLHAYRSRVSVGPYALGVFTPALGATYDGQRPLLAWYSGWSQGLPDGQTTWQTSAGVFLLGEYRPVLGTRFMPRTHNGQGAWQESYQVGVYPLAYGPIIPLASADYRGAGPSRLLPDRILTGVQGWREWNWDADVVAHTSAGQVPLAGIQYRTDAPDMASAYETHVILGVWIGGGFTPVAGASLGTSNVPLPSGPGSVRVSVGPYLGGTYTPVGAETPALPPVPPPPV